VPTFHRFAEQWWTLNVDQWAQNTVDDYRWRLERNLLPFFADFPIDRIAVDDVERYRAARLADKERPLAARSINMTITLLGAILEAAVDRELIGRNPARGKNRKVRERAPKRSHLDAAAQVTALFDAAAELDAEARSDRRHVRRRAIVATLTFSGLRIGELCALRWRDVDLAGGWLHVGDAKTDAGRRRVKIRGALRDELVATRAAARRTAATAYVFGTRTGGRSSEANVRDRVLGASVKRANERLAEADLPPLPERITPHSLRRTFASVLYALGEDPGVVMDEMGHTDPAFALRVYRQSMRRDEGEKAALRALVEGAELAGIGSRAPERTSDAQDAQAA
ncbi:MAG: tyrosine-type recombinase/integrase, partial [Baekduiaceae bacterium]